MGGKWAVEIDAVCMWTVDLIRASSAPQATVGFGWCLRLKLFPFFIFRENPYSGIDE